MAHIACHRFIQHAGRAVLYALICPGYAGFRGNIIFICQVAGQVCRGEGNHLAVIERFDAFHIGIVHLLAAVHRNPFELHGADALHVIDAGFRNNCVRRVNDQIIFRFEDRRRRNLGIEQPERHVHGLDIFHTVVGRKRVRQKLPPFIEFLQGFHSFFFRLFERNDVVRLQHPLKPGGNHGGVATITAFRRNRIFIADQFRAAGGAGKGLQVCGFVFREFAACMLRVPFRFLGFCFLRRPFFLPGKHFFNGLDLKFRTAVLTGHFIIAGQKTQRGATVWTFVADRCIRHIVTSIPFYA